jgi:hypothetical protein
MGTGHAAGSATAAAIDDVHRRVDLVCSARERSQELGSLRPVGRFSEDASLEHDHGVGGNDQRVGDPGGDGLCFCRGGPLHVSPRAQPRWWTLVDTRVDGAKTNTGRAQDLDAAR